MGASISYFHHIVSQPIVKAKKRFRIPLVGLGCFQTLPVLAFSGGDQSRRVFEYGGSSLVALDKLVQIKRAHLLWGIF